MLDQSWNTAQLFGVYLMQDIIAFKSVQSASQNDYQT